MRREMSRACNVEFHEKTARAHSCGRHRFRTAVWVKFLMLSEKIVLHLRHRSVVRARALALDAQVSSLLCIIKQIKNEKKMPRKWETEPTANSRNGKEKDKRTEKKVTAS